MLKRNLALIIVGALLAGGAAVAWANGSPSRPALSAQLTATQAAVNDPGVAPADRRALRDQLRQCMQERRAARQSGAAATPSQACQDLRTKLKALGGAAGSKGLMARGRALFARADHGTFDIKNDSGVYTTYTFDKGNVAAGTSGDQVVVERPDGKTVTLKIDSATKFKGIKSAADLQAGQPVLVVSKDGTATTVAQRDPSAGAGPASLNSAGAGDLSA